MTKIGDVHDEWGGKIGELHSSDGIPGIIAVPLVILGIGAFFSSLPPVAQLALGIGWCIFCIRTGSQMALRRNRSGISGALLGGLLGPIGLGIIALRGRPGATIRT